MIIHVSNIGVGIKDNQEMSMEMARKKLGVPDSKIKEVFMVKKSVDARKKHNIMLNYTIGFEVEDGTEITEQLGVKVIVKKELSLVQGNQTLENRPVVVGFGPAGMFCALYLARLGYRPIVIERGGKMEDRVVAVDNFLKNGVLDINCNVQFGEGGAGTFSDGKLTTRISDVRCDAVLQDLVNADAPREILQMGKPHIGTDKLRNVVKNIRNEIESLGGEVRFHTQLESIDIKNNKVTAAVTKDGAIPTQVLVFATGHSARDTFRSMFDLDIAMEAKAFSVGARIEHLQSEVDKAMYGDFAGHPLLPRSEYQLSWRDKATNRGVYTFCMCPGGYVVPAASMEGAVVTNGMSYHSRSGMNANSALVVSVDQKDYGNSPMDAIAFQEKIEKNAYAMSGSYQAPAQTVGSFLGGIHGLSKSSVTPTYELGVKGGDIGSLFPPVVTEYMKKGIRLMGQRQHGFSSPDGILTAPETRTSSPLRILRDRETCVSTSTQGLYPCGEGSGYAGGIMSAAVDGINIAEKIISQFKPIA